MRLTNTLLLVVLLLLLCPRAWAQDDPGPSVTPDAAASQAQRGDILWYGNAPPGRGGVVTKMKQVAPGVGWAERGGRYFWTTDNGATWTDITPPSRSDLTERISDFYFLDSQTGWALFSRFDKDESDEGKYEEPKFDLVSTTDAGATWTRKHLILPEPADYGNPNRSPLAGWGGTIAFLDALHGWMHITLYLQSANTFYSFLQLTSDGGRTWKQAPRAPNLADADLLLVSPSDGWMIGTSRLSDKELFATHDGTKSWQHVSLDIPKEVSPATSARYYWLPTFEDNKHGWLQVNYLGRNGVKPAAVLFATDDGGRIWKLDRMVTSEVGSGGYGTPTVVDSAWVWLTVLDRRPLVTTVSTGERIDATTNASKSVSRCRTVGQLSFVTPMQGWIILGDGTLVSTTDGGATWTTLKPGPQPHVIQPNGSFIQRQSFDSLAAPKLENNSQPKPAIGSSLQYQQAPRVRYG
jgi:photosystem II stability/assembly factor-like uncharacterized protein